MFKAMVEHHGLQGSLDMPKGAASLTGSSGRGVAIQILHLHFNTSRMGLTPYILGFTYNAFKKVSAIEKPYHNKKFLITWIRLLLLSLKVDFIKLHNFSDKYHFTFFTMNIYNKLF